MLVCEQPLASVPTLDLIAAVRRLSPSTRIAVQVAHTDEVADALEAGAAIAASRATPLATLLTSLGAARDDGVRGDPGESGSRGRSG